MNLDKFFQSPKFYNLIKILGALIVLILVLQLGIIIGEHKTRFAYRWGENYQRAFGAPRGGLMANLGGREMVNGHGLAGVIVKIDEQSLIIKNSGAVEQLVKVDDQTSIKQGQTDLKLSDLKIDQRIVVIGTPQDDGSVQAKMIRLFPTDWLSQIQHWHPAFPGQK